MMVFAQNAQKELSGVLKVINVFMFVDKTLHMIPKLDLASVILASENLTDSAINALITTSSVKAIV